MSRDPFRLPPPREPRVNRLQNPETRGDAGCFIVGVLVFFAILLVGLMLFLWGATRRESDPAFWGASLLCVGGIGILLVRAISIDGKRMALRSRQLALRGDACRATIVSARQASATESSVTVDLDLIVHLSDGRDLPVRHACNVKHLDLNRVIPGASLNVVADPSDLSNFLVEW